MFGGFSRYLENVLGYLDIFLEISGKIFRCFYVIFVQRPKPQARE